MRLPNNVVITHEHLSAFSPTPSVTIAEIELENPLDREANYGEPVNWGFARLASGRIRSGRLAEDEERAIDVAQLEKIGSALRGLRLGFAPLADHGLYCDGWSESLKIECGDWCVQVDWSLDPPENFIGVRQLTQALTGCW
jgi:hypothetical protein